MNYLTIELIPKSCWFSNLRAILSQQEWDLIRKPCYRAAGYKCEICGEVGPKWPVECHEIWEFDDEEGVQWLKGIQALCPDCHSVKHIGLAEIRGNLARATAHLMKMNKWDTATADIYIRSVFKVWESRSSRGWEVRYSGYDVGLRDKIELLAAVRSRQVGVLGKRPESIIPRKEIIKPKKKIKTGRVLKLGD